MRISKWAWAAPGLIVLNPTYAAWEVNITPGVTEISRSVYDLHMLIFYICVAISIVVFSVMLWSIIHHRKSKGAKAHNFHENTLIELAWTIVPMLILVSMAVPASKTLIDMYDSEEAMLDIQITGYQWKWHYNYLENDVSFFSNLTTSDDAIHDKADKGENYLLEVDKPLVIPVDTKVRFLITANDVIHSWWVPDMAVKRDAVPGFINEAWTKVDKVGTYRGQCVELCGVYHGFMPVVVEVKSEADFAQWLQDAKSAQQAEAASASQEWSLEDLVAKGEQVYKTSCAACHQVGGAGIPGAFPALKGSAIATGDINKHMEVVINGTTGTAMQAFGKQLSIVDLAAVITYERNAWGNNTDDKATPQQIKQMMQGGEQTKKEPQAQPAAAAAKEPQAEPAPAAKQPQTESAAADKDWSMEELMAKGEQVYNTTCVGCHLASGTGLPGVFPALKGSPIATGDVSKHMDVVVKGSPGTAMQAYGKQMSPVDLAAVITYERNAWGNNTGDKVSPQQIKQSMQ